MSLIEQTQLNIPATEAIFEFKLGFVNKSMSYITNNIPIGCQLWLGMKREYSGETLKGVYSKKNGFAQTVVGMGNATRLTPSKARGLRFGLLSFTHSFLILTRMCPGIAQYARC